MKKDNDVESNYENELIQGLGSGGRKRAFTFEDQAKADPAKEEADKTKKEKEADVKKKKKKDSDDKASNTIIQ